MNTATLKPRASLPDVDSVSHQSWLEGWIQGICVGTVIGIGLGVLLWSIR